ncbi:MAG TPA: FHA domain-containing protein [Myxococcales bacterium]|nr:FHA domain-containing protein [Myxococcales bacterium]HIN86350.1 FHA domain-containing protein [Myxococcales bacterium]
MHSLSKYAEDARILSETEFRAFYPCPMLVTRRMLGGDLKRHQREPTWLERTNALESITLLHITECSDLATQPVDTEIMQTREVAQPICFPVQKTTRFSIYGEAYGDLCPWPANSLTVGRFQNSDVVINEYTVSKIHAWFQLDALGDSHWLTDAGSTNGTWVGKQRLQPGERKLVQSGQFLTFGRMVVQYYVESDFYAYVSNLLNSHRFGYQQANNHTSSV